ncbi:hypothetical protein D3C75_626840 [compost metagenome]
MANKVQHLRTSVAGRLPSPASLEVGEIAINMADNIMYTKNDAGQVIRVGAGTYTKAEMDAKFLPQGILPVTRVGDLTSNPLPIALAGQSLVVGSAIPVILSGRQFTLPAATTSFAAVIGASLGTVYVYVTLSAGAAILSASMTPQAESFTTVFIGQFQAAAGSTTSGLSVSKVSRLDIYRPSINPIGSAFPVSAGTPDTTGSINW